MDPEKLDPAPADRPDEKSATASSISGSTHGETAETNHLAADEKTRNETAAAPSLHSKDETDPEKQQPPPEDFVRTITGWKWVVIVLSILSSTFLFALDNTIVADIQPVIVTHFNSVGKITWLSVSFLIGAAATNLIWGKIYGQFDAKWLYVFTVFLFEVGSALCGAAPNMDALIVGRAIAGVGGSGMYVGVMTLLAGTTSMHERPMYIGGTGLTWGLGTVLGPIIGGAFTQSSVGWRWSFYINLLVGAVCAPVYLFYLPSLDPRKGVPLRERTREMDYVGTLLIIGAFVSGVMAVSFGGITYAWNSGRIIGLFVCSGVLFILFGLQQVYTIFTTVSRRIFPIEFLKSRSMIILFAMTSAGGTAIFVPIYMIPIFFQFTRNDDALEAGVRLLPYIILMVFAVIVNGAVLSTTGLYWPWYTFGGVLIIIGGALMHSVGVDTSTANVYGYSILIGVGVGCFAQASFSVAQGVVTRKHQEHMIASAIGFITCAQVSGVTIALAIANSVFLNDSQDDIQKILPDTPREQIQEAISGVSGSFVKGLDGGTQKQVIRAIVNAQQDTYILVVVAGALAVLLSLFMKRERFFMAAGGAA